MNIGALIIQLVSGALGGNLVGWLIKKINLGWIGNSIAGIVGGGALGQLLPVLGLGTSGSLNATSIISSILGGGVGGGILMTIVGLIRNAITKKK